MAGVSDGVPAPVSKAPTQPSAGSKTSAEAQPAAEAVSSDKPKQADSAATATDSQGGAGQTEEAHKERAGAAADGAAPEAAEVRA